MKKILFFVAIGVTVLATSCKKEGCTDILAENYSASAKTDNGTCVYASDTDTLKLIQTFTNTGHHLELYSKTGQLQTGYNQVYFKIKDQNFNYIDNANVQWSTMMFMTSMSHGSPVSAVIKHTETMYTGYLIFQMASNESEYWQLAFDYEVDGEMYSMVKPINVKEAPKRVVQSFKGADDVRYVLALAEPSNPIIGVNNMTAFLYKMASSTDFVPVTGYKVLIDPRMPGMGNHSSPNNEHLTGNQYGVYKGKLNLTMSGYWKVNLQLENNNGEVLKGEEVTDDNEASSIYFEIEF